MARLATVAATSLLLGGWWSGACRSDIVVEEDDASSGAGGTSSATSTASGSVVSSSATLSTGSGGAISLCLTACSELKNCGATATASCIDRCEAQSPPCRDLHQSWLACRLDEAEPFCGTIHASPCRSLLNQYLGCVGASVPQPTCTDAQLSCNCTVTIAGGEYGMHCGDYGSCGCYDNVEGVGSTCKSRTFCKHDILDCCATGFFTTGI